jgi:hypothetical protein
VKTLKRKTYTVARSRTVQAILLIVLVSTTLKIYDIATRSSPKPTDPVSQARSIMPFSPSPQALPALSATEKEQVLNEFPTYGSRHIEQTYLTLPEWYQVYSYNEFGDYLQSGGPQSRFPFLTSIKNFWSYYGIALRESKDEEFNWLYNFVDWMIGANLTAEYFIKSVYENTIGGITQFLAGSDTEADRFIADSWNNYAERMYQYTWYHYPYFTDLKKIWTDTSLFDRQFIRSFERKIAFSVSYMIKGTYAQLWLLTAAQKENETYSIVYSPDKQALDAAKIENLKDLGDGLYLIKTERYAGFKDAVLLLTERNVRFVEIMGHNVITLSYLSHAPDEPFASSSEARIIDKRALFFNPDGYTHRVVLETRVDQLRPALHAIRQNGSAFEMIYDF